MFNVTFYNFPRVNARQSSLRIKDVQLDIKVTFLFPSLWPRAPTNVIKLQQLNVNSVSLSPVLTFLGGVKFRPRLVRKEQVT